jgi:ATP-dependent Clp protease adaptor protein ClpS
LARIAEPGIGPVAGRARAASLRLRRSGGGPIFQVPVRPTGRTGSGDLENALLGALRRLTPEPFASAPGCAPVTPFFISNAWAMLQSTFKACPSVPAKSAASAPRMSNDENRNPGTSGPSTSVITKVKPKTKRPNLYRVLILNDDYTPMEFVVHVLEKFFQKDAEAATKIMLHVHHHGIGECGVFTYEIAETKVTQVMDFARKHQHPLQCVMEKK